MLVSDYIVKINQKELWGQFLKRSKNTIWDNCILLRYKAYINKAKKNSF